MNPIFANPIFLNALAPMVLHAMGQIIVTIMQAHGEKMVGAHHSRQWREVGFSQGDAAWWGQESNVLVSLHDIDGVIKVRFYIPGLVDLSTIREREEIDYNFQWLARWLRRCCDVAVWKANEVKS
jgi:hypothetical protein